MWEDLFVDKKRNVMIFIDYENVHKLMVHNKKNLLGIYFFEKLRKWCEKQELRILDIKVYCNFDIPDLHISKHQSKLQSYGLETFHTSNKGKNYADLKITTDLLEELYENTNIDGFIIISNDKDMTPLIKMVKRYKDFIYLVTNKDCFDIALKNFPDQQINIEVILEDIQDDDIQDDINRYKNVEDELTENLEEYFSKFQKNKKSPLSFEYYLEKSVAYFEIYEYELLNIIKNCVKDSNMTLYHYIYNKKPNIGIFPTKEKDNFINQELSANFKTGENLNDEKKLKEIDLLTEEEIEDFFNKKIKESYEKFDKESFKC